MTSGFLVHADPSVDSRDGSVMSFREGTWTSWSAFAGEVGSWAAGFLEVVGVAGAGVDLVTSAGSIRRRAHFEAMEAERIT
jgi:hypothetical protein